MIFFLLLTLLGSTDEQQLFEIDGDLPEELLQKEIIDKLSRHPLDLNGASRDELLEIPFLDPVAVDRIIAWRRKQGFERVSDLRRIPGFDDELFGRLSSLLTVRMAGQAVPRMPKSLDARFRVVDKDFSPTESFTRRSLYGRVEGQLGNGRLVVIADKDSGETNPFDYLSAGLGYSVGSSRFVVGAYQVSAGQGLVFSAPSGFIAGPEFALDLGKGTRLEPKTLTSDNSGFFGFGWSGRFANWAPVVMVSRQNLDAALNPDGSVNHLQSSGLHNDSAGLAGKDRLGEWLVGTRLAYQRKNLMVGVTGCANQYLRQFSPSDSTNSFSGRNLAVAAADFFAGLGDYWTFGEVGYSLGNGVAAVGGLTGDWDKLRVGLSLRGYQRRFFSPHSRFASLANQRDKLEAYGTVRYRFHDFEFSGYGTTYRDFVVDSMPTRFEVDLTKKQDRLEFGLALKQSLKEDSPRSQGMRFDVAYAPVKPVTLSVRLEDRYAFAKTPARGFLGFADCDWQNKLCELEVRGYWFSVESSAARIYAYESGLPGLGGNHSFTGSGFRLAGVASFRLGTKFRLALKAGWTKADSTAVDGAAQVELNI